MPENTAPPSFMTIEQFIARWKPSGAAERSNYAVFFVELCDQLGVPRPDPRTEIPKDDAYMVGRPIAVTDLSGKTTTNFADLYRHGCFVLEAKQGSSDDESAEDAEVKAPKWSTVAKMPPDRSPWPTTMKVQAVRAALSGIAAPATADELAAGFKGCRRIGLSRCLRRWWS